jgi:thymidine phosphorylase
LPQAPVRLQLLAARGGYVQELDALAVARVALQLGAGRTRVEDRIDPSVGLLLQKKPGDAVARGDVLAEIHAASPEAAAAASAPLLAAYRFGSRELRSPKLVIERITRS